ncbi:aspartate kinase [Pseudobacteriovorax antillogorgiicola]|uniref:Aspartokinase n=1 Tax=Pseudobacteriovorax antillogorgiicola TaxID=1513793 RepID=A0A1Y6CJK9_9BACT|nr:aspartate kinase [Pseudobacteriovorax antillogorgiicola]TCS46668.1 aspartate kinase [Pseudobacteriovorax antillogorgiicola]SMF66578.1 aspartate kinase [Pseudobacteriovorax antillogorgiicola]
MYSESDHRPIVQKYGGTSVGNVDRIKHIAKRVSEQVEQGYQKIAIVVSAMSGETNRLVGLVGDINPKAPAKHYDLAVSAGEQVSVALMASALEAEGVSARGFTAYQLGIVTDEYHSQARIQEIDCRKLFDVWERGEIPVIAGFQGITRQGEITTLGRGGSDTSAVALAVALDAAFCEINTDVDGVFTADPRVVPNARLNLEMDFEVALEMASLGSKVLHARCVELGAKYRMPIVVRNTFKENDSDRTKIMSFNDQQRLEAPVVSGVTLARDVVRMTVDCMPPDQRLVSGLFENIAEAGVNVDIIVHNRSDRRDAMRLGFSIGRSDLGKTLEILDAWKGGVSAEPMIDHEEGLAKVSVVGLGMQSHPGVASRCFAVLSERDINIHMISTSEIKISCVISEGQADLAAQALHEAFLDE